MEPATQPHDSSAALRPQPWPIGPERAAGCRSLGGERFAEGAPRALPVGPPPPPCRAQRALYMLAVRWKRADGLQPSIPADRCPDHALQRFYGPSTIPT